MAKKIKIHFEDKGQDLTWLIAEQIRSFGQIKEIPSSCIIALQPIYIGKWYAVEDLEVNKPLLLVNPKENFEGFETIYKVVGIEEIKP